MNSPNPLLLSIPCGEYEGQLCQIGYQWIRRLELFSTRPSSLGENKSCERKISRMNQNKVLNIKHMLARAGKSAIIRSIPTCQPF